MESTSAGYRDKAREEADLSRWDTTSAGYRVGLSGVQCPVGYHRTTQRGGHKAEILRHNLGNKSCCVSSRTGSKPQKMRLSTNAGCGGRLRLPPGPPSPVVSVAI